MGFLSTELLLAPLIEVVFLIVVVVAISLVMRGRTSDGTRPDPMIYFLYGLSFLSLVVFVAALGVAVHAITQLVGPSHLSAGFSGSSSSSGGLDCTNLGSCTNVVPQTATVTDPHNHSISVAVDAGFFVIVAAVGFWLVWEQARRFLWKLEPDPASARQLAASYSYLVAGVAGAALLTLLPLTADNVFRGAAPGVNAVLGHADGFRNMVTFLVLSAVTAAIAVYHLRYGRSAKAGPVAPSPSTDPSTQPTAATIPLSSTESPYSWAEPAGSSATAPPPEADAPPSSWEDWAASP